MLVHTVCPTCSKESVVPDLYVGKRVECAGCGEHFEVQAAEVHSPPVLPVAEPAERPAATPDESHFAQSPEPVNWQGYPYFQCGCLTGRRDVAEYRCFFASDRLAFIPFTPPRPVRGGSPGGAGAIGLLLGLAAGVLLTRGSLLCTLWLAFLGAFIGYMAFRTTRSVAADKFRNQDERFREWKVEDLAAVDPKAFVILPGRTEHVSFRSTKSGWVVVVFRRDNGHEWVIRPVTDPDLKVCLEHISRFGFRVTNTVEWDPGRERYRVVEEEIDLI